MTENKWLPHTAVSYYSVKKTDYRRPIISINIIGDQAQITADAVQFGFSVYEGLRVYISDKKYVIFRSQDHYERMVQSCTVLDMPCPSYATFIEAIKLIVERNYDKNIKSLYIRPIVFATSGGIMPKKEQTYTFAVLCTEFDSENDDIKILIDTQNIRTLPTFSSIKTATNYTSSFLITRAAQNKGYDTILWLDRDGYIQECSTMNIFFCIRGELWTPALGSILPGVTRRTIIELLVLQNEGVIEKKIHFKQLLVSMENGDISYMFTTSTALGINRVTRLNHHGKDYIIDGECPCSISVAVEKYKMLTKDFPLGLSIHEAIQKKSYMGTI